MPKLLVLKHVAHEPLGTLDPLLRRSGFRIRYVNFGRRPDVRASLDLQDVISRAVHYGIEIAR